ncbi:phage major capsid protein [Mycolicibacterium septicum]|uniref:phage major capsid protein n=1 Tax=Mycolicibacterium septicum TaxID=98668 RepID=UPI0023624489|nr:phage major capsid protein [Mycolicibacterium septicum]
MTLLTSGDGAAILRPEEVAALVIEPLTRTAIATTVSTVVHTQSHSIRFPVVQQDPLTSWTAEGAEINVSDAKLEEIDCVPKALKGLTVVSNELADDSDPSALDVVGQGLVRDLQTRLDQAFFGNTTPNGPDGLESLASVQYVDAGTLDNLDAFAEAISLAEQVGATLTNFVLNPVDLLDLSIAKVAVDWEQPLLGIDPSSPTKRSAQGVPLQWSPAVPQGTIWGIPQAKVFTVLRLPATVVSDKSAYFSSDRLGVRCVVRWGFAFPHQAAIVKIGVGGS